MVSGSVNKCVKYLLFAFTLCFVLIGIGLIYLGVTTQNGYGKYLHIVDLGDFAAPPKLCIAIGVIMFLIAFLGCCGAVMENHSMVMAYSVLVGLILIMQLGVGIAAFLMGDKIEVLTQQGLMKTLNEYNNDTNPDIKDIRSSWNMVQSELKCCGVSSYTDWNNVIVAGPLLIPESCCIDGAVQNCTSTINKLNLGNMDFVEKIINTRGCLHEVVTDIAITKIGVVGITLSVLELLGVICACVLARSIRFSYETV